MDLKAALRQPARGSGKTGTSAADFILGTSEELALTGYAVGDLIFDRAMIYPRFIDAMDFLHKTNPEKFDVFRLAQWSHKIDISPTDSFDGHVNQLQGYVFEQAAAFGLRHSGKVVVFPETSNNPGWDFLVNGHEVQAKCGISPDLVTEHLQKYPHIPDVIVNTEIARSFANNPHIITVDGLSAHFIRSQTETSLHAAGDMLDIHLGHFIPVAAAARNLFALAHGRTDLRALPQNLLVDGVGRAAGGGLAHALAMGAVPLVGLTGWGAILAPVFLTVGGYSGGRMLANEAKRRIFVRGEWHALTQAVAGFCERCATKLDEVVRFAAPMRSRFQEARHKAPVAFIDLYDDWLERFDTEQAVRVSFRDRFLSELRMFREAPDPRSAIQAIMVMAVSSGVLPQDLTYQANQLQDAFDKFRTAMRRWLLPGYTH